MSAPTSPAACTLSLRQYGTSPGSHAHDHFQVLLGLHGTLELEVAGRGHRIGPGVGHVVPPGERHDFESLAGSQCLVLDTGLPDWTRCQGSPADPARAFALARYLAQALHARLPHALHSGPRLLLRAWGVQAGDGRPRRPIDWPALAAWARLHWHGTLGVADLAAQAHLSPTQFAARCREETGQSAMHWLRSLRLADALAWRRDGLPVAEVARRCGYRSPSALTAAMRRESPQH